MESIDPESALLVSGAPRSDAEQRPELPPAQQLLPPAKQQLTIVHTKVLPTVAAVALLCGVVVGALIFGKGLDGSMGTADPAADSTLPSSDLIANDEHGSGSQPACAIHTLRQDSAVGSPFAASIFDMTCLADGGTGDPCDVHVAEEFSNVIFGGLRADYLASSFLSLVVLFSLAMLGGVPRPIAGSGESALGVAVGSVLWTIWMSMQAAQLLAIIGAFAMDIAAFFSFRARLEPCLLTNEPAGGGGYLIDQLVLRSAAAQPVLLGKAALIFAYAFLLSLGMAVYFGRYMPKASYVAAAARDGLRQPVHLTTTAAAAARVLLFSTCFNTLLPPLLAYPAAIAWVVLQEIWLGDRMNFAPGFYDYVPDYVPEWLPGRAQFWGESWGGLCVNQPLTFYTSLVPLALAILANPVYLPLVLLYLGFVKGAYKLVATILSSLITTVAAPEGRAEVTCALWSSLPRDSNVSVAIASLANLLKTILGWLHAMDAFDLLNGPARRATATGDAAQVSLETLASGLSTCWMAMALAGPIIYSAWGDIISDASPSAEVTSSLERVGMSYSHTLGSLFTLEWQWGGGLLPSVDQMAALLNQPLDHLHWIASRLANGANGLSGLNGLSDDPTTGPGYYYLANAEALCTLNLALALVRIFAAYARHALAVFDALGVVGQIGTQVTEGTVQVHECLAPPEKAARDSLFAALLERVGVSMHEMRTSSELRVDRQGLTDEDIELFCQLIRSLEASDEAAMARPLKLYLSYNQMSDRGLEALSQALATGVLPGLTELYLGNNQISDDGVIALAEVIAALAPSSTEGSTGRAMANVSYLSLRSNQVGDRGMLAFSAAVATGALARCTELHLGFNRIGDEGLTALTKALDGGALPRLQTLYLDGNPEASAAARLAAQQHTAA